MMKTSVFILISISWLGLVQPLAFAEEPATAAVLADHAHFWRPFQTLLDNHLSRINRNGIDVTLLDYAAVKGDEAFAEMVGRLENFSLLTLKGGEDALAFWINAYNFLAVKIVADHYPVESIKVIGSLFRSVWNKPAGVIAGRKFTLGEIEHDLLRKKFDEPRLHFALVCASLSCPDLRKEVYLPEKLDEQLDDNIRSFLGNPTKGLSLDPWEKKLKVSRIFSWFEDDFEAAGGIGGFIQKYRPDLGPGKEYAVDYLPYDWSLNGK